PPPVEPSPRCVPRRSREVFQLKRPGKDTRCKTRQCVVCRWECGAKKSVTEVTDYCDVHDVCLCSCVRRNYTPAPYMCPNAEWTCWEKFHNFYMPEKLFVKGARLQRGNRLYKLRSGMTSERDDDEPSEAATKEPSTKTTTPVPLRPAPVPVVAPFPMVALVPTRENARPPPPPPPPQDDPIKSTARPLMPRPATQDAPVDEARDRGTHESNVKEIAYM
ncbi:hypothetical protein As57867_014613, partial [Aphanomyces stellatus]